MYAEALQAQARIDDPQYAQRILSLQAAIKYEQDDMAGCRGIRATCSQ